MFNTGDILETIEMFTQDNLDVRTVTMGISLLDCIDPDPKKACENIYNKITTKAANLVPTVEHISAEYGIPIINKRISVTPIAMLLGACPDADPVEFAKTLDAAGKKVGVNFVGGYSALVHKGFSAGDRRLIESIPRALAETDIVCSSVNIGATKAGLNMDAVKLMGEAVKKASELTADRQCIGAAKLVVFCNAPEDNPFMAGAFHGPGEPDCEIHVGVSGPGAVRAALARLPKDAPIDEVAELVKRTAFKITRVGQLVANLASKALGVPAGIIDLSLAPTPAIGDSVANILEEMGLETCGCCGTTACLALLNDAVKKGGVMASNHVGGLSGAFIPVSEDAGMIHAAEIGCLTIEKLEAMTAVCSVGIDMVIIPGDTTPAVISALIADEAAIGTAPAAERADYCESILRFATVRQMPGALAFGQGQVAKRVAHLLKYRKPAPLLLALGCVLVALGCGACALRPQAETITPQAEPVSAAAEPTPEPATPADDTLTNSTAGPTAQPEQPQATAEPLVFGWPVADFHYIARFVSDCHHGADYSATKGTPVLAVYNGTVAVANNHFSYGNYVVIDHGTLPDGHSYRTLYAHLDTLSVAAGDTVTQGQQLGTVGSTGKSTGNHLHLELFVDGALTDTRTMIPYDNTTSPDLHLTTTLDFICPLESYTAISAPFRTDDSDTPPHLGVDFAAAGGTPVQAAQSGVVTQAGWDDDHGYFVTIYHGANAAANDDGTYPANYATSYAHLQSKPAVQVGQRVAQGDVIGYVGSTGSSTGNHLHFQLLVNGTPVDPLAMLPQ